ncbi:MAG: N-acetylmuramoyl-L-alanine amidase [Bacteroidales bacterium]|nr:N-acetylmuramoyl-L-alanine amidase [Bacteroidales bacterium]
MKRTIYLVLIALLAQFTASGQGLSLSTVVIDPGHGGKDPGAVSKDGKTYEKTLTLDIAKKLESKIRSECPGVNVVLTRSTDKNVDLGDRAAIANKENADLFISIHINSTAKSGPNGYSVHVLGKSSDKNRDLFAYNMDVCKRENSVILLEDDYTTTYQGFDPSDPESFIFMQLMQNSHLEQSLEFAQDISDKLKGGPIAANRGIWQNPFLVLWKTSMPSVLVELGFISNATDLAALKSESNRDKIAARLCEAFKVYKDRYDMSLSLDDKAPAGAAAKPAVEEKKVEEKKADGKKAAQDKPSTASVRYGIQIFAGASKLSPKDKAFMGYEPVIVNVGKIYKYVIAVEDSAAKTKEHLSQVRKEYPDAFMVKIEGDKLSLYK